MCDDSTSIICYTIRSLSCFVMVKYRLIYTYHSGLLHSHWGNPTIAPVPVKQPWRIWVNYMNALRAEDTTITWESTTKPCAYFMGYNVIVEFRPLIECHYCKKCNPVVQWRESGVKLYFCAPGRQNIKMTSDMGSFPNYWPFVWGI